MTKVILAPSLLNTTLYKMIEEHWRELIVPEVSIPACIIQVGSLLTTFHYYPLESACWTPTIPPILKAKEASQRALREHVSDAKTPTVGAARNNKRSRLPKHSRKRA